MNPNRDRQAFFILSTSNHGGITKKNYSLAVAFVVMLLAFAFTGQGRDDWRYGGRILGKMSLRDSLTVDKLATFHSRVIGTSQNFATIDSFTTTAAVDTITMTGAEVGDVFFVTEYTPTWSPTPDTGAGNYRAWVISANTVVVGRTKLTAASTLKSAAAYMIGKIEK